MSVGRKPSAASRQLLYPDSRPWTRWWWFNVELREEDIRRQLDWVKANGFGGVELAFIYPLPGQKRGPDFLSPEWSQKVAFAKRYCDTLGLGCDFTFGTLWPFGGTFVSEEDASQRFDGPSPQRLGRSWELPAEGRILNHLDRGAFYRYADKMAEGLAEALGFVQTASSPSGQKSVESVESVDALRPGLFCDSFEVETEGLWASGFDKAFMERFGYDVRSHMPKLDEHPDVRYDYRKLIAEYVLKGFYEPFTEYSHRVNSFTRVQCHGAPADTLAAFAAADVPESEAILFDPEYARIPASAAALTSKPVVSAEAFTCLYGWIPYPGPGQHQGEEQVADLKLLADALFANGVNHIFWHGMPYQTGADSRQLTANSRSSEAVSCKLKAVGSFYASVHVGPDSAFASELPAFNGYMEKVCAAMKLGRPYSDVAAYLPIEDQWMRGELPSEQQKPSAKYHWELHYLRPPSELFGRQPLWVSTAFLKDARFEDGKLRCGEAEFSLLYVDCEWLDEDALAEVLRLAKQGVPVCLRRVPKRPGRAVDKRIAREYQRTLDALTMLDNVSSDLGNLSQEPPLVSGRDVPDFWCRAVDDELLFFFGHPASRGLTYPMKYGRAAQAVRTGRDLRFNLGGTTPAFDLPIEFGPCESLLLRASRTGRVERLDLGYVPPRPKVSG
jgi:hypothetical protein